MAETGGPFDLAPESVAPALAPSAPTDRRSLRLAWWLLSTIVVVDQITKWLVQQHIPVFSSLVVIPGLVDFVHVHNTGVAFGFMNDLDHPWQSAFTTTMALLALIGIVYYATHLGPDERRARVGLSLILGGAIGNLIDRARLGYVVDFVDVYWQQWHFWAFNVADSAISVGAVLIFVDLLFPNRHVSHSL